MYKLLKLNIILLLLLLVNNIYAQEVRVIDNKGTLKTANNNSVTSSATMPTLALEGDIWYDTSTAPTTIKVYDDGNWVNLSHTGQEGSVFFASGNGVPTEDNDQFYWDDTLNRLHVGLRFTANADNKLNVAGTTRTSGLNNADGTTGTPSFRFTDDKDTGMYSPAQDEIGFSVGGIEAMNIDETTGNTTVIINETLELNGQVLDENNTAGTAGQVLTATLTGTEWVDAYLPTVSERYPNATQTVAESATFTTINFQAEDFAPTATDYTNATDGITVHNAGRYKITYRITSEVFNNNRTGGEFHLIKNGVIVNNTKAYTYQRNNLINKNTVTMIKFLDLIINDKIGVQGKVYESNRGTPDSLTIIPEGSMLTVEKIN